MTDPLSIGPMKLLRKARMADDVDFLRAGMRVFSEAVMELEVTQHIGAERHARTPDRTGQRNGYRERRWDTRVGTIDLQVPRVRDGSYFPALLDPRRRAEWALVAVVQEAYVHGVSTRRVDDLVQALGIIGISKSEVSRLCETLDAEVARFRTRPLTSQYPYIWLDATDLKVRQDGRVVPMAVVIAIGVTAEGRREVLGFDVGPSEEVAFWEQFLRGLVERGRTGVRLVASDAHAGLKRALTTVLHGASWQRCRVQFRPQRARPRAEGRAATGGGDDPHGLRATRRGECAGTMAAGGGWLPGSLSPTGGPDGRRRGRCVGLSRLSVGPLATNLVEQSLGTAE
jgi:putative transposase